jgi:vacuolar protein sorting-associated protein 26
LDELDRKRIKIKEKGGEEVRLPTFTDRDNIAGKVIINLNKIKNLEHKGIKIELMGLIEHHEDKKNVSRFIALGKDLEPPGIISQEVTTLSFTFNNVEMQYETYRGSKMTIRYILRVTIPSMKQYTQDLEFGVSNPNQESILSVDNNPIRLEVGIEDWLHLVFEVDKSKYHLRDCITGQVVFKKVSIRLKSMELQIIKRETIGAGVTAQTENETIVKFEIMDGGPIKSIIY